MKQEDITNELNSDKALTEALLGKEALNMLDAKIQEVPTDYFNEFPDSVIQAIRSENSKTKIIHFSTFSKIAVAAAILLITATGYIFSDKILTNNNEIAIVNIEEITNVEIEKYVESNEFYAEVDWQNEIDNASTELESNYILLKNDTN